MEQLKIRIPLEYFETNFNPARLITKKHALYDSSLVMNTTNVVSDKITTDGRNSKIDRKIYKSIRIVRTAKSIAKYISLYGW